MSFFHCIIVGGEWQSFWSFLEDFEKILKNVYRIPWEGHNESSTKEKINTYPPLFIALLTTVTWWAGRIFLRDFLKCKIHLTLNVKRAILINVKQTKHTIKDPT